MVVRRSSDSAVRGALALAGAFAVTGVTQKRESREWAGATLVRRSANRGAPRNPPHRLSWGRCRLPRCDDL